MGNDNSIFRKCYISSNPYHVTKQWSLCKAHFNSKKLTVITMAGTDDGFDVSVSSSWLCFINNLPTFPLTAMESHQTPTNCTVLRFGTLARPTMCRHRVCRAIKANT